MYHYLLLLLLFIITIYKTLIKVYT